MTDARNERSALCLDRHRIPPSFADALTAMPTSDDALQRIKQNLNTLLDSQQIAFINICLNEGNSTSADMTCSATYSLPLLVVQAENSAHTPMKKEVLELAAPATLPKSRPLAVTLRHGGFIINRLERRAWLRDQQLSLTPKEFDLLWWFICHPQHAISREDLVSNVWGPQYCGYEHTVSNHVNRLRKKLGAASGGNRYIDTVWGLGYRFNQPDGHL